MPVSATIDSRKLPVRVRAAAIAFACMSLSFASAGLARNVYRCGNTFQDLPCPEPKVADKSATDRPATRREAPLPCAAAPKDATDRAGCSAGSAPAQSSAAVTAKR